MNCYSEERISRWSRPMHSLICEPQLQLRLDSTLTDTFRVVDKGCTGKNFELEKASKTRERSSSIENCLLPWPACCQKNEYNGMKFWELFFAVIAATRTHWIRTLVPGGRAPQTANLRLSMIVVLKSKTQGNAGQFSLHFEGYFILTCNARNVLATTVRADNNRTREIEFQDLRHKTNGNGKH
jgi:hypothetical protein